MQHKKLLAGFGLSLALVIAFASTALAVGTSSSEPTVSVRVEGVAKTLLEPTHVTARAGSLSRFGAPSGKCPDDSAAGALDAATHHNWKGTWESSFGDYEVTSILGETHTFASKKDYWEIFVNNRPDQTGACESKLKPGEQILFAAVPQTGPAESVLAIIAPLRTRAGFPLRIGVRTFTGHEFVDVAGAKVTLGGLSATTNRVGVATVHPTNRGSFVLQAEKAGYVRGATRLIVF